MAPTSFGVFSLEPIEFSLPGKGRSLTYVPMSLSPKALALAAGILNGGVWFLVMAFSLLTGIGDITIQVWGALTPWFSYTWGGLVITTIENFLYAFVGGWIFAWLYNRFQR